MTTIGSSIEDVQRYYNLDHSFEGKNQWLGLICQREIEEIPKNRATIQKWSLLRSYQFLLLCQHFEYKQPFEFKHQFITQFNSCHKSDEDMKEFLNMCHQKLQKLFYRQGEKQSWSEWFKCCYASLVRKRPQQPSQLRTQQQSQEQERERLLTSKSNNQRQVANGQKQKQL